MKLFFSNCLYSAVSGSIPLCQKYGEMCFSLNAPGCGLAKPSSRCSGPINANPTRCTTRGCRNVNGVAATQPMVVTTIAAAKHQKPSQLSSSRAANMWLKLRSAPVVNTIVTCTTMKSRKYTRIRKCSERASWMLSRLLIAVSRIDSAGPMPRPVSRAAGAAMNTVVK